MPVPKDLALLSRDELLQLSAGQQGQLAEQEQQIAELTAMVEGLRAEVERLKREGPRQAAQFSKGTRVATSKQPGRKPGAGPFRYRAAPEPALLREPRLRCRCRCRRVPRVGGGWKPPGWSWPR